MVRDLNKSRPTSEISSIISADLTAATDLIPLDLVKAVWDGILKNQQWPLWCRNVVDLSTGP
jgi:hypothetical protein